MNHVLHTFGDDGRPQVIAWFDDFDGPHQFEALSNFFIGEPIYFPTIDEWFMTGEHAYQAAKAGVRSEYRRILKAQGPGEAKALGNTCVLRPDWEAVKYDVMSAVVRCKFTLDREEGDILLETGDALLVEGTYWQDRVWGVALHDNLPDPLNSPGRNWLGTLLMARRAELRAQIQFQRSHRTDLYNMEFVTRG